VKPLVWTAPGGSPEMALGFDRGRPWRLLVIPALFDEANKLRRFSVEVMRRLDAAGIDVFLPDMPGTNESLAALEDQTPEYWRDAMTAAAEQFQATHLLSLRGGALVAPDGLPGWRHAPVKGAIILRQLFRARILASREAGREETQEGLAALGEAEGLELSGYRLSPQFLDQFVSLQPAPTVGVSTIEQDMLGGPGLWLRAEPGEDRQQADALAAIVALGIKA